MLSAMNLEQEQHDPIETPADAAAAAVVSGERFCIRCGYSLQGLRVDGVCPECGTSVALSLREPLLANADPEYLRKVKSGLSAILNGILVSILMRFFVIAIAIALPGFAGAELINSFISLGVSAWILWGYWRYTEPDPAQVSLEATNSARSIVRRSAVAQGILAVVSLVLAFASQMGLFGSFGDVAAVTIVVAQLLSTVLWAVQFFGVMRYTRWLAGRVPDMGVIAKTKRNMWLLPLLYTVGILLIGLGPLIALIIYWNLLDRMRKHLKSILATGRPAALKAM